MNTTRVDEFHRHGCNFYGKLVVVEYMEDVKKDKHWGEYHKGVTLDYLETATKLVKEKYGTNFEVKLSIPTLVVNLLD